MTKARKLADIITSEGEVTFADNVGIGVDDPSSAYYPVLHVKGENPNLRLQSTVQNGWSWISTQTANENEHRSFGVGPEGSFRITNNSQSMDLGIQLSVLQNGNVGIGTSSPESLLHVKGDNTWIRHTSNGKYMDLGCWVSNEARVESDAPINIRSGGSARIEVNGTLASRINQNVIELNSNGDLEQNAGIGYFSFRDYTNTEKAWIGYGSGLDTNFRVTNSNGGAMIFRNGGNSAITIQSSGQVSINSESHFSWANLYVDGNLAVQDILYLPQTGKIQGLASFPGSVGSLALNPDGGNVNFLGATGRALDGTQGLSIRSVAPAIGFEATSDANDYLMYVDTGGGISGLKFWNADANYDSVIFADDGNKWFLQPGLGNGDVFFDVYGSPANRARMGIQVNTDYTRFQAYGLGSSKGDICFQPLGNRVGVGTTTTRNHAKMSVKGGIAYGTVQEGGTQGAEARSVLGWYAWAENGNYNRAYVHLKTNLWGGLGGNTEYTMSLFEVKGYRYSPAGVARGLIGFHNWSNALPGLSVSNDTSWNIAQNPYISTDGYVVLVIYIGGSYGGFTLDWHQIYPYPYRNSQVANIAYSTNATGAF